MGLSVPPPPPRVGEHVSQELKEHVTEMALGILEQQLEARIVHYRADLATNPELDEVTAAVVEQLHKLQAAAQERTSGDREATRAAHERTLRKLLERVFPQGSLSLLVESRLKRIHRKLARLFFQSELHGKTRGREGAAKVIQHGEQAMFYLLSRYKNRLHAELGGFEFASEEVRERSFDLLAKLTKDMQDAFLSRRSTELRRIVKAFDAVLVHVMRRVMSAEVGSIAAEVVTRARTNEGRSYTYKIAEEAFPRFRAAMERALMVRLVGAMEDLLVAKLADTAGPDRDETVQFITDPQVFSMICGELCDGMYEILCNEGFLDLPPDWRVVSAAPQGG
ncbi:hypothetical protein [Chondromyces apiculatus]|uniref:Uncharacterized protein n=1 Tax=Chondromyces apiculatus DSM 436 TaxID=1192034 RepID=A0A017TFI6_9BACT|nr:hypothetical protein [Chondromyces apiculatus]EYF08004.1 Hypothetical protein CAP_7026 [Chondromyces apiculatus DSM 436]